MWYFLPKEYSADTMISDETKEVEFEVGISKLEALIRYQKGIANEGINNIETYCEILKSKDFAQKIAEREKLLNADIEDIQERINYNISYRNATLKIAYTDRNPENAARILQTIIETLQNEINEKRHQKDLTQQDYYNHHRDSLKSLYENAVQEYSMYSDSNSKTYNQAAQTVKEELANKLNLYKKLYHEADAKSIRFKMLAERPYSSFATIKSITVPTQDNSHPLAMILCFNLIFLLITKAILLFNKNQSHIIENFDFGDIFAPWNITFCVWAIILVLLALDTYLNPLSKQFYISLALWLGIFLPVSIISSNLVQPSKPKRLVNYIDINQGWFDFFFAIAIIITPLYAYEVYKIISMFVLEDVMKGIRQLAMFGDGYGFLNYAYVIDLALLIVGLWRYPKIPLWQLLTIIVIWLIYAICLMAKGQFMILFVSLIYVLFMRKVIRLRTILIVLSVILILFYFFNLAREGGDYEDNESFVDFIGMYVLSASVAYGKVMPSISEYFGSDVFWTIYYYGNKLFGTPEVSHQINQDFVNVPILTNVYTIFRPYFADFGQIGVAIAALVYGVISGVTYRYARYGYAFSICLYTYLIYALSMQFFDAVLDISGVLLQFLILMYLFVQKDVIITKFNSSWKKK
ncbi:MAG: oligosaccharide repeat unit polymerase [Bacteroidales bacterium]|nr:oligosaccharide repeat unit polymerase [Bacteroidales bacterium]